MKILYRSTRGKTKETVSASSAILQGLSPDGGLYVPTSIPKITFPLDDLPNFSYQELAYQILKLFFSDFTETELRSCITKAYGKNFDTPKIAPMSYYEGLGFLELFHGPTIAFKDVALQLLPHLMSVAASKKSEKKETVILTATSGDTGKAALAGFANVPHTKIIVFYPKHGVSFIQERQMLTQQGKNTFIFGVDGNFDDAQTRVKKIFNDTLLENDLAKNGYRFSSANSINIGRLFPQVVYYFYAYSQLLKDHKIKPYEKVNFSVPTGNFGNILAGYYAKKMGLPVNKLLCASNKNNVLTKFFNTGLYDRKRPFYVTSSPSMDILISSNLERLLFYLTKEDPQKTSTFMKQLEEEGNYTITSQMRSQLKSFYANFASEDKTAAEIDRFFSKDKIALDPHTAVASYVARSFQDTTEDEHFTIVVSTASPYKFAQAVLVGLHDPNAFIPGLEAVTALQGKIHIPLPPTISRLFDSPIRAKKEIKPHEMERTVKKVLGLN
ncbi:threonine synthase [Liquorilactobacillus oeni]|uniref:Threonine synthase n=1 Tax=Liquorilactobacillus oeni DSM 19972 TaxID=1423777 RepID=A0A0R1MD86_9LACO|nr:threonine synthase [Liquorilactobacillus oeni]KRL05753.1 threonine synthase [Liquorilactobacillus oeni DSM 19972]